MSRLPSLIEISQRVKIPADEIELSYARSGGPGGQHANKTSTKVLLRWSVKMSRALEREDRAWLLERLDNKLTEDGELLVTSERHRDQGRNVEDALEKFVERIREALQRPAKRRKSKPSSAAQQRRVQEKRKRGALKRERRSTDEN
jgi:ribosome-associated protein